MCAFSLPTTAQRDALLTALWERGVIMLGSGPDSVRFRPALTVTRAELERAGGRGAGGIARRGLAFRHMRPLLVLLASAALLVLAGCAHTVAGVAVWNPAQSLQPLRADDTDQILIGPAQLRDVAGVKLQVDADQVRPIAGSSAVPACSALDAAGMAAFLGTAGRAFTPALHRRRPTRPRDRRGGRHLPRRPNRGGRLHQRKQGRQGLRRSAGAEHRR